MRGERKNFSSCFLFLRRLVLSPPPPTPIKIRKACYKSIVMTSLKVEALTLSVVGRPRKSAVTISR